MNELLDDDGENRAVRAFLAMYGSNSTCYLINMRSHLASSGFPGCWPEWVQKAKANEALTKAGAQDWLRHLFNLEGAPVERQAPDMLDALKQVYYSNEFGFLQDDIQNAVRAAIFAAAPSAQGRTEGGGYCADCNSWGGEHKDGCQRRQERFR